MDFGFDNVEENIAAEEAAEEQREKYDDARRDIVICVVDAREPMYGLTKSGKSFISGVFDAIAQLIKVKATEDPLARIGVILAGTKEKSNKIMADNIYELQPPSEPSAGAVRTMRDYALNPDKLRAAYGALPSGSHMSMHNALWQSNMMISEASADKKASVKRIWIFTNDDRPEPSVADASRRAKQCSQVGEMLLLWPMAREGRGFDLNPYWKPLLDVAMPDDGNAGGMGDSGDVGEPDAPLEGEGGSSAGGEGSAAAAAGPRAWSSSEDVAGFLHRGWVDPVEDGLFTSFGGEVRRRAARKRVYARVIWTLAEGVHIAVGIYNTVYPAKKPSAKQVDAATQQPVSTTTAYYEKGSDAPLQEHQMLKTYALGGQTLVFSDSEAKDMRRVMGANVEAAAAPPAAASSGYHHYASAAAAKAHPGPAQPAAEAPSSFEYPAPSANEDPTSVGAPSYSASGADRGYASQSGAGTASSYVPSYVPSSSSAGAPVGQAPPESETKGLRLMGFKPQSAIDVSDSLKPPVYLYPAERDLTGSTVLYRALWQRMLARKQVAICRYNAREASAPRFVALWPEAGVPGVPHRPPGLYAVTLPFADDYRAVTVDHTRNAIAGDDMVDAARQVVRAGRLRTREVAAAARDVNEEGEDESGADMSSSAPRRSLSVASGAPVTYNAWEPSADNPTMQKFWRSLEALALHEAPTWDDERDDTSAPLPPLPELSDAIRAFKDAAGLTSMAAPAGKASGGAKRSRAAADDGEPADAGIDWAAEVSAGTLESNRSITLDMLKAYLRRAGLPVSGKKAELVARVSEHLGSGGSAPAGKKARKG